MAKIMHIVTAPVWIFCFKFFIGYEIIWKNQNTKYAKRGALIISNHLTWADPFMVGMLFPITSKLIPFRWIAARRLFYIPIIGQLVWMYGSIRLKKNRHLEENLEAALFILEKGGTVGIFPEGRRRYTTESQEPKIGVAYLVKKVNPTIIPFYIDNAFRITAKEVLLRKRKVRIIVGEEFKIPNETLNEGDFKKISGYLMEKIEDLKK